MSCIKRSFVTAFTIIVLLSGVCSATPSERSITIAAASDLVFALREISTRFKDATGVDVILSFGSTGKLTQQIENGAPFDLFFAANEGYIDRLEKKGFILSNTRQLYARGRIALAFSKRLGRKPNDLSDLSSPDIKVIAIANPAHAPYGIAAREALISSGLWDRLNGRLVYAENIRQTLQFIESGNAEAGIVALSLAKASKGISYTVIDTSLYRPINQAVAVVRGSKMQKEAGDFIGYVNSPEGRAIMRRYGFLLPDSLTTNH